MRLIVRGFFVLFDVIFYIMKDKKKILLILGKRVREIRKSLNISQEELAEICNFDRTYISLIERGQRNISFINLLKLSSGLKTTPSELLNGIDYDN